MPTSLIHTHLHIRPVRPQIDIADRAASRTAQVRRYLGPGPIGQVGYFQLGVVAALLAGTAEAVDRYRLNFTAAIGLTRPIAQVGFGLLAPGFGLVEAVH